VEKKGGIERGMGTKAGKGKKGEKLELMIKYEIGELKGVYGEWEKKDGKRKREG
jgi:hypothetical protein